MAGGIRVLHIDDEPGFAEMAAVHTEREDDRLSVEAATSASEGLERFREGGFDCLVADHDMPGQTGIELLETVRETHPDLPFILFTGKGSEDVAERAISAGVTDYLQKRGGTEQYALLANRITNAVERYRLERESERTRGQLEAILDHSADAIVTVDADSRIRFANAAVKELFGHDPADIRGQRLTRLMPPREREAHLDAVARYLDTGERTMDWSDAEFVGQRADGTELPLSVSFGEFEQDGQRRFIGIMRDISERTQLATELRQREAQFRQLAEHIDEVVWMSDLDAEGPSYVNPAFEEIWGRPPETLYEGSTRFLETVHPADRDRIEAALDTRTSGEYDETYRIVRPDGEVRWVRDRAVPVENDAGETVRVVGIASDVTERTEQMRRLETLVSNLPGVTYRCRNDRAWPMEFVRGECESLTGYTPEEIEDGSVMWGEDIIHPDDREAVWNSVQDALDAGESFEVTYRIRTADGAVRWVWERGRAVDVTAGDSRVLEGFVTDITAHKRREQQLEEVNTVLSTLVETLPVGVLAEDDAREVMVVNRHLFDLLDLDGSPEAAVGDDCERLADEVSDQFDDPAAFVDRIDAIIGAGDPVDDETLSRGDGRTFQRSYRPLDLEDGDGHLWVYRDVTERTEREQALEGLTHRLESLHRATGDLLAAETHAEVADIGVTVAAEMLGLEANAIHRYDDDRAALVPVASTELVRELVGEPPTFTAGDSIAWRTYQRGEAVALDDVHADDDVYNPASAIQSELQVPIGDHGILIAGSPTAAAFDEQDRLLGELLAGNIEVAFDQLERTEQLRERERELTRQNDRLAEFTSVVSHDLRNPLNVASGRLELAREECDSEHLDAVGRAHDRMEALVEDLLTLAREGGTITEVTEIDVATFAQSCWENVATGDATLVVDTDATIRGDGSRLKQLFENLVRNSVEHGGDDVTVTVGDCEDGFYVADDGPGIPPNERDQVFEAGYSTQPEGTGFGLSIVRQVAEAHGWSVRVTDGPDGGARFEITGVERVGQ
ncbi:hybrid sensor histidine kinase/response regulator [Halorarius halobius]|uniref:hybrid sensor histidine kinase/response regulator n=1 Tax=Halorarius halobius TaxID=2962671 RepID=UPI0020CFCC53|nr:PAS domain S-box protein [Halorarius halobius]